MVHRLTQTVYSGWIHRAFSFQDLFHYGFLIWLSARSCKSTSMFPHHLWRLFSWALPTLLHLCVLRQDTFFLLLDWLYLWRVLLLARRLLFRFDNDRINDFVKTGSHAHSCLERSPSFSQPLLTPRMQPVHSLSLYCITLAIWQPEHLAAITACLLAGLPRRICDWDCTFTLHLSSFH